MAGPARSDGAQGTGRGAPSWPIADCDGRAAARRRRPAHRVRGGDRRRQRQRNPRLTQRRDNDDPEVGDRAPERGERWIPPPGPERDGGSLEPPVFPEAPDDDADACRRTTSRSAGPTPSPPAMTRARRGFG